MIVLDDPSGKIEIIKEFDLSDNWLVFLNEARLKQKPIKIFGKELMQPRLTGFFGEHGVSYKYSNQTMEAEVWGNWLKNLASDCSKLCEAHFNSVLANYYRDGRDSMGLHADNEKELGRNPSIASLSYGQSRKMIFRKNNSKDKIETLLEHGDLLLMTGGLQHFWKHEVPKSKKVGEGRLNLTFREINS